MKATKFYTNLSISILLKKRKVISAYARNDKMMIAFAEKDYGSKPPIYFSSLKMRIDVEVKKQKLRDSTARILKNIFKFNDPFHLGNQRILGFLSDIHLKCLEM